jgi:hypothetical protein
MLEGRPTAPAAELPQATLICGWQQAEVEAEKCIFAIESSHAIHYPKARSGGRYPMPLCLEEVPIRFINQFTQYEL